MFDWAKFRKTKGAVKLHMVLDHDGYLPTFCNITTGKEHEIKTLKSLYFQLRTIAVFDRGCIDYDIFLEWTERGVYFITCEKDGMNYGVVERRKQFENDKILRDELILLIGFYASKKYSDTLRRVVI